MRLPSTIVLLMVITSLCIADKLVLVQEIFRHGARETFYADYDGLNYQQDFGELTSVGLRQHFVLGQKLREEYILGHKILPPNFNHSLIRVRTTDVNRTIMSAYAHLTGLYPPGTGPNVPNVVPPSTNPYILPPYQNLTTIDTTSWGIQAIPGNIQAVPIHTVAPNEQFLLRSFDLDVCPNQQQWQNENRKSSDYKRVSALFNQTFADFSANTGLPLNEVNLSRVAGTVDVYQCDEWESRQIPEQYTNNKTYRNNLNLIFSTNFYITMYKTEVQKKVSASLLMNQIISNIQRQINVSANMEQNWMTYSAHDTTIAAVLQYLNYTSWECLEQVAQQGIDQYQGPLCITDWPAFASNLIFELWQQSSDSSYYLQLKYNGVFLPLKGNDTVLDFNQWKSPVLKYALSNPIHTCGVETMQTEEVVPSWVTVIIFLLSFLSVIFAIMAAVFMRKAQQLKKQTSMSVSLTEKIAQDP